MAEYYREHDRQGDQVESAFSFHAPSLCVDDFKLERVHAPADDGETHPVARDIDAGSLRDSMDTYQDMVRGPKLT